MGTLPSTFDPIFNRYRGKLPLNFMKALAKRESNMNPRESRDPAWGLMQIVPVVRTSYNKRFGTSYSKGDLLDPDVNVKMASELLNRIATGYGRFHPNVANARMDWSNPEFVQLVVAGWNSGYSEAGGVGRVMKYLEQRGIPVTHDNVFRYAGAAGATRHLQNETKRGWQKTVSNLFYAEGGPGLLDGGLTTWLLFGVAGLLTYELLR